jgi:hypothetical protein
MHVLASLHPRGWTLVALGVEIVGGLWMAAQALYAVPILLVVPLVPAVCTALASAMQREAGRVSATFLLALACFGEVAIVVANRSVLWRSAEHVLSVPTPPGTLEPYVVLATSYWVWHLALPAVALALAVHVSSVWSRRANPHQERSSR